LHALQEATAKYRDLNVALADGFVSGPVDAGVCLTSPEGVRGYHYSSMDRLLAPLDLTKPAVLIYQPRESGGLKLVAVEFFEEDFDAGAPVDTDRPSFGTQPFEGPLPSFAPGMPIHYALTAWVWQHNPAGTFAHWNPAGSCDTHHNS
jgi:hypothetical protein